MADNDNPVAIAFTNKYLRPISEAVRNLDLRLGDAKVEWLTNVTALWAAHLAADKLLDGSPADGRTTVTKQDHDELIAFLVTVIAAFNASGVPALLAKFTVSPPRLNG